MVEVIGFIISLLAVLYLFVKENAPKKNKRPIEKMQKMEIQEDQYLESLFKEEVKKKEDVRAAKNRQTSLSHPPKRPKQSFEEYRIAIEKEEARHVKSALENKRVKAKSSLQKIEIQANPLHCISLEEAREVMPSKAKRMVQRLNNRRDLLIYQEIMDLPKSMRPSP